MAKHKHVAREFRGLDPEQMKACGGKPMPTDAQGRKLTDYPFNEWVQGQVRDYRAEQLESLAAAELALRSSLGEAERQVELFTAQLDKNAERQAEFRAKARA